MKCYKCGKDILENVSLCPICGTSLVGKEINNPREKTLLNDELMEVSTPKTGYYLLICFAYTVIVCGVVWLLFNHFIITDWIFDALDILYFIYFIMFGVMLAIMSALMNITTKNCVIIIIFHAFLLFALIPILMMLIQSFANWTFIITALSIFIVYTIKPIFFMVSGFCVIKTIIAIYTRGKLKTKIAFENK